jgi:hypothetical protein
MLLCRYAVMLLCCYAVMPFVAFRRTGGNITGGMNKNSVSYSLTLQPVLKHW